MHGAGTHCDTLPSACFLQHRAPCCPTLCCLVCRALCAAGGIIRAASQASGGRPSDVDEAKWLRNFLKARQVLLACAAV